MKYGTFGLEAGDTVYWLVTSHPNFPRQCHEGDGGYFAELSDAQRIADVWNSYNPEGPYSWRVVETVLLPRRIDLFADSDDQLAFDWGDPTFVCEDCGRETHIRMNGSCLECADRNRNV